VGRATEAASSMGVYGLAGSTSVGSIGVYGSSNNNQYAWGVYSQGNLGVNGSTFITGDLYVAGNCNDDYVPLNPGSTRSYDCSLNDIAELMDSAHDVEAADIVATDDNMKLVKADKGFNTVIGIVSSNPTMTLTAAEQTSINGQPIALAGLVPVKVNTENGPIKKGDFITASSTAGYGMKATGPCTVVGKALQDFDGDSGQITVFVSLSYFSGL